MTTTYIIRGPLPVLILTSGPAPVIEYSTITFVGTSGVITFSDFGGATTVATDDYTPRYQGDVSRPLQATFVGGLGNAYNLTGASGLTLKLRNRANVAQVITGTGSWAITNALTGQATYTWSSADVALDGDYDMQVSATMPDGEKHWNPKPLEILPVW